MPSTRELFLVDYVCSSPWLHDLANLVKPITELIYFVVTQSKSQTCQSAEWPLVHDTTLSVRFDALRTIGARHNRRRLLVASTSHWDDYHIYN